LARYALGPGFPDKLETVVFAYDLPPNLSRPHTIVRRIGGVECDPVRDEAMLLVSPIDMDRPVIT
jgi:hypothetical protein